jgi:hypothetical protein
MKDNSDRLTHVSISLYYLSHYSRLILLAYCDAITALMLHALRCCQKEDIQGIGKSNWKEVRAEYSPDSQLLRQIQAKDMQLTQQALELI